LISNIERGSMQNYDVAKLKIAEESSKQVLLDEAAAAARLSLSPQALRLWRQKRKQGLVAPVLPFVQLGRLIRYRIQDVDQFLLEQIHAE
jgi:hypothetical protein